jgi:pSer/pThr/pTyr-binding forkhead associated (FHA) protein
MTSGEVVDFDARRSEEQAAAATGHRFSLVCLTSDEPQAYDVDRPAMVIGRSSDCDIQILTHFVSREHARLERDGGSVLFEDLGSTHGVVGNAVRIERQPLRHGDWVTIGETQFRFIDGRST